MTTIVWSPEAVADLRSLRDYIGEDDPVAAKRIALQVIGSVEQLLRGHGELGRPGRVPGTRELVIAKTAFIVPYRLKGQVVEILRVYHSGRRWPGDL